MEEHQEKKIDESWKEATQKEKKDNPQTEEFLPAEPDFTFFVSTLAMQAAMALGDLENPVSKKKEVDLRQAKFFIDTLSLIKEKTAGNLSLEEDGFLEKIIYELKLSFVEKSKDKPDGTKEPPLITPA
jgi:hypothetical protein